MVSTIALAGIAFYALGRDLYAQHQVKGLIKSAYSVQRPGGGRLAGLAYAPIYGQGDLDPDVGMAQALLLSIPESASRQKLQAQLYIAFRDYSSAAEILDRLFSDAPDDAHLANDLGVVYLALAEEDARYLIRALPFFNKALQIDSAALEPRYNRVVLYKKLRFSRITTDAAKEYQSFDSESPWSKELSGQASPEPNILEALESAIKENNLREASRLFDKQAEFFRALAMQYVTGNHSASEALVNYVARETKTRFGDETLASMLGPLLTGERDKALAVRQYVRRGAELYFQSNIQGSLDAYANAEELLQQFNSPIDRYWLDINKVDTQIRAGQFETARESLVALIRTARERSYLWFLAKALSIYGSSTRLAQFAEMMAYLSEAEQTYAKVGAARDSVRPLYYLAGHTHAAQDHDESLRLALRCLMLTEQSDAVRLASLNWLLGSILYKKGMSGEAVLFESESLEQAKKTKNPIMLTSTASTLALLYETLGNPAAAETYLNMARTAFQQLPSGPERLRAELTVNLLDARIHLNHKRYPEAQEPLERNLAIFKAPIPFTYLRSQSLMLLARVYEAIGRADEARVRFSEAIELVENDGQFLKSEKLRLVFDDERRELYDSAIAFEYNQGSHEAAWTYLQKYRAKLFLEFLAQFTPDITGEALERSRVQKALGKDLQVVEYALLKDRLLIWLTTDTQFISRTVPITASALEAKVQQTLPKVRTGEPVDELFQDLGKVLIDPISDLLDSNRAIAFIPDRSLHGLPFAALPTGNKRLVEQYTVVVSPTLTHLVAPGAARPDRNSVVTFGSQTDDVSETKELTTLNDIYSNVTLHRGRQVDKPTFLKALNTAPIFHYAGHSATDAVDPLRSSILLDGNRYGPNSVTAVDIAQQRLPNNALVVLSSCDSSVGNSRDGVGMRGLTSAFLIGGAGSVVGSLWPVEASSTADLMIRFHRGFATEQMAVAHALRKAQLTFLKSYPERSHPYYWSGFVVTGNFSALR